LTLDVKPQGLLVARTAIADSGCRGNGPQGIFAVRPELRVPFAGAWVACGLAGWDRRAGSEKNTPDTSPSVRLVATDPVDVARSEDGHAVSPIIARQDSGSVAGGGQVGPAINLDVDCGEDRHLALQAIPALRV